MHPKLSSANWQPFCPSLYVLRQCLVYFVCAFLMARVMDSSLSFAYSVMPCAAQLKVEVRKTLHRRLMDSSENMSMYHTVL